MGGRQLGSKLMIFIQCNTSHNALLCRNPFLKAGCYSWFHPDIEKHINLSTTEAMSVVFGFQRVCVQISVDGQLSRGKNLRRWASLDAAELTFRPEPHPSLIPSRPHSTVDTSSSSRFAADGSWPGASTSGGPILAGGGDSE